MRVRRDDLAADRRERESYPADQFAVTAAILFAVIIVIGMLYAIGVVKP